MCQEELAPGLQYSGCKLAGWVYAPLAQSGKMKILV
jgi:hypothetical protein